MQRTRNSRERCGGHELCDWPGHFPKTTAHRMEQDGRGRKHAGNMQFSLLDSFISFENRQVIFMYISTSTGRSVMGEIVSPRLCPPHLGRRASQSGQVGRMPRPILALNWSGIFLLLLRRCRSHRGPQHRVERGFCLGVLHRSRRPAEDRRAATGEA